MERIEISHLVRENINMGFIVLAILASCGFIGYQLKGSSAPSCDVMAGQLEKNAASQGMKTLGTQTFPVPGTDQAVLMLMLGNQSTGKIELHAFVPEGVPQAADGLEKDFEFVRKGECVLENGVVLTHLQKNENVLVPQDRGI